MRSRETSPCQARRKLSKLKSLLKKGSGDQKWAKAKVDLGHHAGQRATDTRGGS
jgi:hypothetical protein